MHNIPGLNALVFVACLYLICLVGAFLMLLGLVVIKQIIENGRAIRMGLRELYGKNDDYVPFS